MVGKRNRNIEHTVDVGVVVVAAGVTAVVGKGIDFGVGRDALLF